MISKSNDLDVATICCLSLRKTMELRNSAYKCKQKSRFSYESVAFSQKKKRKPLKCRKNTISSKSLIKTPVKDSKKSGLDDLRVFNASRENLITSTPISKIVNKIIPCEVKLRKLSFSKISIEKKSSNQEVSEVSLIKPVEPANKITRLSNSSRILRFRHSSKKATNVEQTPIFEKSGCRRNFFEKQICSVQKTKFGSKSATTQKEMPAEHGKKFIRKCSSTSQKQIHPITSTPMLKNSISKCTPKEMSRIEKNTITKKLSEVSEIILPETSNETSRLSSGFTMTLRCRRSLQETSCNALNKAKSMRNSIGTTRNLTPVTKSVQPRKQNQKSLSSQRQTSEYRTRSSVRQVKTPSKCSQKSSASSKNKRNNFFKKVYSRSQRQKHAKCKSLSANFPIDDLAVSLRPSLKRKVKSANFNVPGKNTLKRKRNAIDALKKADEDYEDDIYESQKFEQFKELLVDTSDSEMSYNISTPKLGFQVTPLIRHKTPVFRDCFSLTEYAISRKVAEECMYRNRNRKRKSGCKPPSPIVPEKKKLEFSQVVSDACKIQKTIEKQKEDESDEDSYFSM